MRINITRIAIGMAGLMPFTLLSYAAAQNSAPSNAPQQSPAQKTGKHAKSAGQPTLPEDIVKTEHIGSGYGGSGAFNNHTTDDSVKTFGVRWDGDKIRGIKWVYFNGAVQQVGGYDETSTHKTYTFKKGETLATFTIRDSGYGYGSLRSLEFTTSTGGHFAVGPGGYDSQKDLNVQGSLLKGFFGIKNPDNFINCLGLWVSAPAKEIVVSNVTYNKNKVKRSAPNTVLLDSGTLDNTHGSAAQYMSLTKTLSYSQSSDWTSSWGVSSSVSVSIEAGVPGIAQGSVTVSAEKHQDSSTGASASNTITTSFTTSQTVKPHQKMRVDFFSTQEVITIPFSCNMVVKYANGKTRTLKKFRGIYTGSTSTDIVATPSSGTKTANKTGGKQPKNAGKQSKHKKATT